MPTAIPIRDNVVKKTKQGGELESGPVREGVLVFSDLHFTPQATQSRVQLCKITRVLFGTLCQERRVSLCVGRWHF